MVDTMADRTLDMASRWSGEGQGIFLLLALLVAAGLTARLATLLVVLFRGWPPADDEPDNDE